MDRTVVELLADNAAHAEEYQSRFDEIQDAQHPSVVTVSCSDSRVLQDHLWGNDEPGRIFTCANIGNRVIQWDETGQVVSGDVLFPIEHTGTETAIVVGHTGCGAVTATYDALTDGLDEPPGIEHCIDVLIGPLEAGVTALPDDLDQATAVNHLVEFNVDRQVEFLLESKDVPESVDVVGVVYDFQDVYDGRRGEVHVINVNGTRDVERLRATHPEVDSRIKRLWAY